MSPVLDAALAFHHAGICVIPAAANGTKQPWPDGPRWKQYQAARPTEQQLQEWFTTQYAGLGIVCGAVSGGIDMLEFEGRAVTEGYLEQARAAAEAAGIGDTWRRLTAGYMEISPTGGLHFPYRIDGAPVPANTKLAERPAFEHEITAEERADIAERADRGREWWPRRTLMETRGEGGFTVTAPSSGTVHPTGKPWGLVSGGPATIPVLTAAEHTELYRVIRSLDRMPAPAAPAPFTQPGRPGHLPDGELKPGEDYNQRADWMTDILGPIGWKLVSTASDGTGSVRRPGKDQGISATINKPPHANLYVFSTSTEFDPLEPISKFRAYAVHYHGGDHSAAARALRQLGYGAPLPAPAPAPQLPGPGPGAPAPDDAAQDAAWAAAAHLAAQVAARVHALRVEQIAREQLAAEDATAPRGVLVTGREFLAQADEDQRWRIDGLWPAGGNVILAAAFKSGKTTMRDNLIRSWCDGGQFLGTRDVIPAAGPLMVIDTEMAPRVIRQWLRSHRIARPEGFDIISLRGRAGELNPLSAAGRDRLAKMAAGHGAVLLDCLGPVLGALGLDENSNADVTRFLDAWDGMLADAGVPESLIIHHMGHGAERARGAARLRDWPDAEWRLMRTDPDNPASPRFFSAYGRDVDVPEARIDFTQETRQLILAEAGGTRRQAAGRAVSAAITEALEKQPGMSGRGIEEALMPAGHGQKAVRDGLRSAVRDGLVTMTPGPHRAWLYTVSASVRCSASGESDELVRVSASPYRRRRTDALDADASGEVSTPTLPDALTPNIHACPRCFGPVPGAGELCPGCAGGAAS